MSGRSSKNKFGLSREIPAPIKRTVRQECRFGCVLCGQAIYQYEHITPFHKVNDHIPKNIALLCGTHHDQVTRGLIAKDTVRKKRLNPYRLSHRWPHTTFDPVVEDLPVILGGAHFFSPKTVLSVFGQNLLSVREPEEPGAPIRLSAEFYDDSGKKTLAIDDNECTFNRYSWDIEARGTRFTIRKAPGVIALRIRLAPDRLAVERLRMQYGGVRLEANEQELRIFSSAKESFRLKGRVYSPAIGIQINRKRTCTGVAVTEPRRRRIGIFPRGGDAKITGQQPQNTDIGVWGGARSLTIDIGGEVTVGGAPPTQDLGLALSMHAAMSLTLEDLDILVGVGARKACLSLR